MKPLHTFVVSILMLSLIVLAGCRTTLVPMTQNFRTQHNLTDDELQNLQYYVSHTVVLRRELQAGTKQVTPGHALRLTAGKTIEEVIIRKHTPGVAVAVGMDFIDVSFEQGCALRFRLRPESTVRYAPTDTRYAVAPEAFPASAPPIDDLQGRSGPFFLDINPSGSKVQYQERFFDAVDESLQAHLLINSESIQEKTEQRTIAPGRRLSEHTPRGTSILWLNHF